MINKRLYKYINLPIKVVIGVGALIFIYFKIKDDFLLEIKAVNPERVNYIGLLFVFILMFLNWGIEAYKWKYVVRKSESISLFKAMQYTFMGITAGILTPNRIAEIPVRALLLNKSKFKELTTKTLLASYSQMLATLFFGVISLYGLGHFIPMQINSTFMLIALSLLLIILFYGYFNPKLLISLFNRIPVVKSVGETLSDVNRKELLYMFTLSVIRYGVFSLQYFIILSAFGIHLNGLNSLLLIPLSFLLSSIIPTILLSELGVRGSVAILVFGLVSQEVSHIVFASISLWFINVAVPALFGLTHIRQLNLIQQS
ncbi:MAG: flippase-like domain-containing protein [Flavobacteriales bacterium]|nr:flippase-like domain-containing protein [Flavobacteriales bacterium]